MKAETSMHQLLGFFNEITINNHLTGCLHSHVHYEPKCHYDLQLNY